MGWLSLFPTSGGCSLWVASFGSNRSASPVKRYLRWTHILCSLSLGGLRTVWENRRTEPLPTAAAVGRQPAHSLRYLCSTSIARITDQSALTDGLRLAGSRQRFRPGGSQIVRSHFRVSGRAADTASGQRYRRWSIVLFPLGQEELKFPESRSGSHVRSGCERHYCHRFRLPFRDGRK